MEDKISMEVFCKRCDKKFKRESRWTKLCLTCFKKASNGRKLNKTGGKK
jgi:hypothetical protein